MKKSSNIFVDVSKSHVAVLQTLDVGHYLLEPDIGAFGAGDEHSIGGHVSTDALTAQDYSFIKCRSLATEGIYDELPRRTIRRNEIPCEAGRKAPNSGHN